MACRTHESVALEAKDRRGVVLDNLHQDHLSVAGHTTHRTHSETSSARPIGKLARFDSVPGDSEFIPLPEKEPKPVTYP
jgi:hypothetical protein